jgi:hypothetical protein
VTNPHVGLRRWPYHAETHTHADGQIAHSLNRSLSTVAQQPLRQQCCSIGGHTYARLSSMRLAYALAGTLSALLVTADTEVFSHEDLVSAPRPQPAHANPNGTYAVSAVDRWDPEADK